MAKTKDLRKKSIDLNDFSERRIGTPVRTYARARTFLSIIHLCQETAFQAIRAAKTVGVIFVSVVKTEHYWPATNSVSIRITTTNNLTFLCCVGLKRYQTLHY